MEHSIEYQRGWQALAGWLIKWFRLELTPEQCDDVVTLKEAIARATERLKELGGVPPKGVP